MAKNSREGNQSRNKRYREALAERGIRPVQVLAPESAHPLIRRAATLMTRDEDPMDPRAAMRAAGGANEPEPDSASAELLADLATARSRIAAVELDAEKQRTEIAAIELHMQALQAERDAAMRGQVAEREKAQLAVTEAQTRTLETLQRAEKAEAAIQRTKALPGIKGRLVRWLAATALGDR